MTKFLNISTDNTLGGNSPSDEVVSSQKAIKDYIAGAGFLTSSDLTNYVTLNTSQEITAPKTFTDHLDKKQASMDIDNPSGIYGNAINFTDKNGVIYNYIQSAQFADGTMQSGLAVRANSNNAYTEIAVYQAPNGTYRTYAPASFAANSIVTTLSALASNDFVQYSFGNLLKVATGRINSATANAEYTFNYGITFLGTPVVVFGRRTNTTTTSVTTQCWVRGTPGTSSCKIYSNSTSAWSAEVIVIGY